jgi:hypothetical protein
VRNEAEGQKLKGAEMRIQLLVYLLLSATAAVAQTISGSVVGSVKDPSGLGVAQAEVALTQTATNALREARTNERGDFVFASLPPGEYSLAVKVAGFKTAQRRPLMLTASETLPVGDIVLEVGNVTDSVTVTTEGAVVQTASSERAGVITGSQVQDIQVLGRNVTDLLALLPGVVQPASSEAIVRSYGLNVNGNRNTSLSVSIDGMGQNQPQGANNGLLNVSQDAVAEVKILLSNYQAEYGRFSGGNVQVITKSGTRDFHGLGSYFKRHEQFNATNFFANRLGQSKPRYRYNTWNYNIGGPVYIPNRFNRDRDKLFFFWSQEFWPSKTSQAGRTVTVPTELERGGDFSQSRDLNNALIPVLDPTTRRPLPGNIVPASQLDRNGQALLRVFPAANFFDRSISAGRYNYVFSTESEIVNQLSTLKLDYNITPRHLLSGSVNMHDEERNGFGVPAAGTTNWDHFRAEYITRPKQVVIRYQTIISPSLVNELYAGGNGRSEFHHRGQRARKAAEKHGGLHARPVQPRDESAGCSPERHLRRSDGCGHSQFRRPSAAVGDAIGVRAHR